MAILTAAIASTVATQENNGHCPRVEIIGPAGLAYPGGRMTFVARLSRTDAATGWNVTQIYVNEAEKTVKTPSFKEPVLLETTKSGIGNDFVYVGCWLGDRGGALKIGVGTIKHLTQNKEFSFSYKTNPAEKKAAGTGVLLEIKDPPKSEFLKQFVYLKFEGKDETLHKDKILLRGYETFQDYKADKFVTSEYFYRDSCKKLN